MIRPKRGDIYLVNFDPTLGAEIRKTRPALILQNDVANKFSPVTIVAAIRSQFEDTLYPTEVLLSAKARTGLAVDSVVLLNQIRTVDKRRLAKQLGRLSSAKMEEVNQALRISVGLVTLSQHDEPLARRRARLREVKDPDDR